MSKQTKKPTFGDDLDAPGLPLPDDARLYGVNREAGPPPTSVPEPVMGQSADEEWLKFSSFLRRATYVRLKQSEYWDRLVLKKTIDAALSAFLDTMSGADRPLPEDEKYRLNGKKIK